MEPRIAALGVHVDYLKRDVATITADTKKISTDVTDLKLVTGAIKTDVSHLPTKQWAMGAVLATLAVIGALVTTAPKLQQWAGFATPPAPASSGTAAPARP